MSNPRDEDDCEYEVEQPRHVSSSTDDDRMDLTPPKPRATRRKVLVGIAATASIAFFAAVAGYLIATRPNHASPATDPDTVFGGGNRSPSSRSPLTSLSTEPSQMPTSTPSFRPSTVSPSSAPSGATSPMPSSSPTPTFQTTTFYAIGDAPYSYKQQLDLATQMSEIPKDAEFVIHVGVRDRRCSSFLKVQDRPWPRGNVAHQ